MTAKNIKIHLPHGNFSAFGPGKSDLLKAIQPVGPISAAARVMGMSYKWAWDLLDSMSFSTPLVVTATAGSYAGGRYRDAELKYYLAVA